MLAGYYIQTPEWDEPYLNYLGAREWDEDEDSEWTPENVFADDDTLVGSIVYNRSGFIRHLYIAPAHRGRGLLREMLDSYVLSVSGNARLDGDFTDPALGAKVAEIVASNPSASALDVRTWAAKQ